MKARDVKGTRSAEVIELKGRVLPKKVHVKWEWQDTDPWLNIAEELDALTEKDKTVYVGEYRLVNVRKVSLELRQEIFAKVAKVR